MNLSTQSVLRFPDILGGPQPRFGELYGIYHRGCFGHAPRYDEVVEAWEEYQRECFRQRNNSESLFNNVVAFDTDRFLCYRYLNSEDHQLFEFPRLLDWHLDTAQLQTLYQLFLGFDEDTFAHPQQVFTPDFMCRIDPVQELVEVVRYWSLVLPIVVNDADFIALGSVLNFTNDLALHPQLVDFARLGAELGVRDQSEDPEFIPDNLQGELMGFAPSQMYPGKMNLHVRIYPRDDVALTVWEALELRSNLIQYAEAQELHWEAEPLLAADDSIDEDSELPRWE